jgi:drug/metabolite transporter (DMT)-like permease
MDWYGLALISALLSALAAVLQKKVLFEFDALDFSFVLSLFNALIAFFLIGNIELSLVSNTGILILFLKTILGAFAFWFVMLAIKNMEISGALPLMVLTPGIVAVFSFFILGERINSVEIAGMILLLFGTYILEIKKGDKLLSPFKVFWTSGYHHYIVYALLLFTASAIIDKLLLTDYKIPPFSFVILQQIFLAVNFTFLMLIYKRDIKGTVIKLKSSYIFWILMISVATIGYRYTQIEAFKIAPVALVLSIKRTSVFFASIIGGRIFSESNLLKKGIAILIMLYGAYLLG